MSTGPALTGTASGSGIGPTGRPLTVTWAPGTPPSIWTWPMWARIVVSACVDGRAVLANPGGVLRGERLADMLLGLRPQAERLLDEAELRGGVRAALDGVGALELVERGAVVALPAELDPAVDESVLGVGLRVGGPHASPRVSQHAIALTTITAAPCRLMSSPRATIRPAAYRLAASFTRSVVTCSFRTGGDARCAPHAPDGCWTPD